MRFPASGPRGRGIGRFRFWRSMSTPTDGRETTRFNGFPYSKWPTGVRTDFDDRSRLMYRCDRYTRDWYKSRKLIFRDRTRWFAVQMKNHFKRHANEWPPPSHVACKRTDVCMHAERRTGRLIFDRCKILFRWLKSSDNTQTLSGYSCR